jgi:hypothetical protein
VYGWEGHVDATEKGEGGEAKDVCSGVRLPAIYRASSRESIGHGIIRGCHTGLGHGTKEQVFE